MLYLKNKDTFWIQAIFWTVILVMPIMFTMPEEDITWMVYIRRLVMPLTMMVIFYINLFWLAPRYLGKKRGFYYLLAINAVIILILAIALNRWMEYDHQLQNAELVAKGHEPIVLPPGEQKFKLFSLLRNAYSLSAFAAIGVTFEMSQRWRLSEIARKEAEVARRDAELLNLRNQVNPHFLLNTLNNIYALIAFDPNKAQDAVLQLSKMMRHVLYDNQQPLVSLKEEANFIHNYVNLMKMRIDSHVKVSESINIPATCTKQIAPLIIISLVENAFKHGISPTQPSEIDIDIHVENEDIICSIRNTNFPKADNDQSGHGIGLQQVRQRLDLAYPLRYKWDRNIDENKFYTSKLIIHDS